jgi:hypothetical protein
MQTILVMETIIKHKGPHPGVVASVFAFLFITGLSFVVSLNGQQPYFPGPWEPAGTIATYFQNNANDVLWCAFFQFGSAIPLGIFTATMTSRIRFLGGRVAGVDIALFGGFLTAFSVVISSMLLWTMSYPGIAADVNVLRALYYFSFAVGGVGYSVPLGLLIAGISVTSFFMKTLPKWLTITGVVLALIGELSFLTLVNESFLPLIPLTRFPGFIWLIIAGFKLPNIVTKH